MKAHGWWFTCHNLTMCRIIPPSISSIKLITTHLSLVWQVYMIYKHFMNIYNKDFKPLTNNLLRVCRVCASKHGMSRVDENQERSLLWASAPILSLMLPGRGRVQMRCFPKFDGPGPTRPMCVCVYVCLCREDPFRYFIYMYMYIYIYTCSVV